jgi:hypothetical protein
MGLFDRFSAKKPAPAPADSLVPPGGTMPENAAPPPPSSAPDSSPGAAMGRLRAARDRLEAKDLPGAVAIYDEVLKSSGDRADVLVKISGDLGSTGYVSQIIELIAPRYDAGRHGPAAGFNLLQAYLAVQDSDSAQHVLDLLFALNRPDLEERLFGFSNAIAELLLTGNAPGGVAMIEVRDGEAPPAVGRAKVGLVTISKPIWFYGLEAMADRILPPKEGQPRRIAFAQLALPGAFKDVEAAMRAPEEEMGRLARALPTWLAEVFYFSPAYTPVSAVAFLDEADLGRHPMLFSGEWGVENLRQVVDSTSGGLDYIFTGSLRQQSGDYELTLRLWEVKKFRERKQFTARWTPATVEKELTQLRQTICQFMEWSPYPAGSGIAYETGLSQRVWIDTLAASLNLFLAKQKIIPAGWISSLEPVAAALAGAAPSSPLASLSWLTLQERARTLGLPDVPDASALASDPLVEAAAAALRS